MYKGSSSRWIKSPHTFLIFPEHFFKKWYFLYLVNQCFMETREYYSDILLIFEFLYIDC